MYELTCDIYLNENRSSVLQPLFNASVVTTRMDGYEETGAGNAGPERRQAGLDDGDAGAGRPLDGLVGSNIVPAGNAGGNPGQRGAGPGRPERGNRTSPCWASPGFAQSVRGAKTGTTALQLGAGLSVPVGTKGTIYVNGNADIRDGSSALNGSVGYRYDF